MIHYLGWHLTWYQHFGTSQPKPKGQFYLNQIQIMFKSTTFSINSRIIFFLHILSHFWAETLVLLACVFTLWIRVWTIKRIWRNSSKNPSKMSHCFGQLTRVHSEGHSNSARQILIANKKGCMLGSIELWLGGPAYDECNIFCYSSLFLPFLKSSFGKCTSIKIIFPYNFKFRILIYAT